MVSKNKIIIRKTVLIIISCLLMITSIPYMQVYAEDHEASNDTSAVMYKFTDKNYKFENGTIINNRTSLGTFSVSGDFTKSMGNNVPVYYVNNGNIKIQYKWNIDNTERENYWYIGNENTKRIDVYNLGDNVGKGVIIIQSSKDMVNWSTNEVVCDFIESLSNVNNYSYETNEIQINSGCYYRLIVAYKFEKYTNGKFLFMFNKKNYEYERYAEVYTFFAFNDNTPQSTQSKSTKYVLADTSKWCSQFTGYSETKDINVDDIHYGWNLGDFLVSGHSDVVMDNENIPVVLKNLGDKVVLWFRLEQNIESLNGDDSIRITADTSGKDQYFGTETMNFGKGTLIISKKDYEREQKEVEIYTNYLEAYVVPGVDTMISLFEEGDYEVTLDYEVTKDTLKIFDKKLLDKTRHYKISFNFKVRNSNCMVYPLDVTTDKKLINGSYTKDGFYLDLAKSRYLQINVKKSDLKDGTYDLSEDVNYNQLAQDGERFTDEGLYTITVTNRYTGISDEKKIYVGDNDILKAYAVTGMSISDIKKRIEGGAVINDDGTIGDIQYTDNVQVYAGLDDEDLATYIEDTTYLNIINELGNEDYFVERVDAKYVSKDYIDNLTYNSMNNLYFGYDAKELNTIFGENKFVFTLGDDYNTIVKPIEIIDDNISKEIFKNVVVGSGAILLCVTVSAVAAPTAPAVSVIFAASATTGTTFALHSGLISGITSAIVRGYQTGDPKEALKSAMISSSEGFKWGAISGVITGGAKETFALYKATENGLTMNQVAKIQRETGYPLDVIKLLQNEDQVKILQKAGIKPEMIDGKLTLSRDIDLDSIIDGKTNRQRILEHLSPLDPDGNAYELHHVAQDPNGTLAILTETEHRASETYSIWHMSNKKGVHSQLVNDNIDWNKIRIEFWNAYLKLKG